MHAAVKLALDPGRWSSAPVPEGSFVLRTTEGAWLERGVERYWLDVREARACAKGFSTIHTRVRVHVYQCLGNFPWWVETWLYGVRTISLRERREVA